MNDITKFAQRKYSCHLVDADTEGKDLLNMLASIPSTPSDLDTEKQLTFKSPGDHWTAVNGSVIVPVSNIFDCVSDERNDVARRNMHEDGADPSELPSQQVVL